MTNLLRTGLIVDSLGRTAAMPKRFPMASTIKPLLTWRHGLPISRTLRRRGGGMSPITCAPRRRDCSPFLKRLWCGNVDLGRVL